MPELPEVEIASRNLTAWTAGRTLRRVETPDTARFEGDAELLTGLQFTGWTRTGKYLVGELAGGVALLSHLGMTGQWIADAPRERRHQRVIFVLEGPGPRTVSLVDPRRFGWTWITRGDELPHHPRLVGLGVDPLDPSFSPPRLREAVGQGGTPLKSRLMNQRVVAGLGNIAVSELGWRAGVHLHRACDSLSRVEWIRLWEATRDHLSYVLEVEDGDEIEYQSSAGAKNPFLCYGRAGEPCARCSTPLERDTLSGRVTFYCPQCQELNP